MKKIIMVLFMLAVFGLLTGISFAASGFWDGSSVSTETAADVIVGGNVEADGPVSTNNYFQADWSAEIDEDTWDMAILSGSIFGHPGTAIVADNGTNSYTAMIGLAIGSSAYSIPMMEDGSIGMYDMVDPVTQPTMGFCLNRDKTVVFIEGSTLHGIYESINDDSDGMVQNDFDCHHYGNVVTNAGATGSATYNLPAAAAGMEITFVVMASQNMDINPDDADKILGLTDSTGDAIRCSTVGNTITLVAVDATNWVVKSVYGTWTDIN